MSNKSTITILAIAILIIGGFLAWSFWGSNNEKTVEQAQELPKDVIVYYYGAECPHCKDVMEFLEKNNIAEKVDYEKKEVWHNSSNNEELALRAQECGLDPQKVGVPFLYAEGECYIGTPSVTQFFSKKAGL